MGISAALIGVAVSGALGSYQAINASNQATEQKNIAAGKEFEFNQKLQEQARQKKALQDAASLRDAKRQAQLSGLAENSGTAGTILTGPLGLGAGSAAESSGGSTLLGS